MTIIDYNRVVKDLNGLTPGEFLAAVGKNFTVEEKGTEIYKPAGLHNFSLYLLKESFLGTATVMMTICGAVAMSYWMNAERIPNMLAQLIVRSGISATGFNMLVVLILLIMGMFMTSGLTIMTPLLVPIASALNIDLIHFGMVMVFTLGIGNMSPPFGIVLYQVSSLLGMKLERLVKASFPFLVLMVGCAVLYALVPWFSTWLPAVLYG